MDASTAKVVIVDYERGNLFSVKNACAAVGMNVVISQDPKEIAASKGIVFPGVGAFGDAMANLKRLDLLHVLKEALANNIPFLGICLGFQLLMEEGYEHGHHKGLGFIEGAVRRFDDSKALANHFLKVPQIGWKKIFPAQGVSWYNTLLRDVYEGDQFYFVHSYYAEVASKAAKLSVSQFDDLEFCSSIRRGNVFGCQFHPERSGEIGLSVYRRFKDLCELN